MSAQGAISGQGCYSELTYQGRKLKVAQWHLDAMQAVSEAAFLNAANMLRVMGGTEKAVANREVALARSFSLGSFGFDAIVDDGGLDNSDDLLATFLFKLLEPHDATIQLPLAVEIVKKDRNAVAVAVRNANPRKIALEDKTGQSDQGNPATSNAFGNLSQTPGETSEAS